MATNARNAGFEGWTESRRQRATESMSAWVMNLRKNSLWEKSAGNAQREVSRSECLSLSTEGDGKAGYNQDVVREASGRH